METLSKVNSFLSRHLLLILHDLLKNFILLKIYGNILRESFIKMYKIKEICVYFLFLIMKEVPYSWYKVHILTKSYEKKSSDSGDYVTILHGFCQFWQYLSCNFEKKLFLSGVIVSVNRLRKDIKQDLCLSASIHEDLQ